MWDDGDISFDVVSKLSLKGTFQRKVTMHT